MYINKIKHFFIKYFLQNFKKGLFNNNNNNVKQE